MNKFKRLRSEENKVFEYFDETPKIDFNYQNEKAISTKGGSDEAVDEFTGDDRPS